MKTDFLFHTQFHFKRSFYPRRRILRAVTNFQSNYVINRFPIMVAFSYIVARKFFNDELAKSLAVANATHFAILKRVSLGFGRTKARFEKKPIGDEIFFDSQESFKKFEIINFAGGSFIKKRGENIILAIAFIRGKQSPFTIEKFNREVEKLNAIAPNGFNLICAEWEKIIKNENLEDLKNGKRFFQVWRQYRDKLREAQFWFK
jgi:hypothetical protein